MPAAHRPDSDNGNSLKCGDKVVVGGFLAKDGSKLVNAHDVKLADGTKVFAGSSGPK